jgi:hypothetical protein
MSPIITDISVNSKVITELNTKFHIISGNELLEFLTSEPIFNQRYLPVNFDKKVVTGLVSSRSAKMSLSAVETLVNNKGTLQRFEGLNDDEEVSSPVRACALAVQHRYETIALDFDCIVFGETKLPNSLLDWLVRAITSDRALLVRGNRKRLTLIFRLPQGLAEKLQADNSHKQVFTLDTHISQKVEIAYGYSNNTIWGSHPSGNEYQQVLPSSGKIGELPIKSYKELIGILDGLVAPTQKYKGNSSSDNKRVFLEDTEEINDIVNEIRAYEAMNSRFNLGVEIKLDILDLISDSTKKVIAGELYFDGSNFVESKGSKGISEGGRFHTWFVTGSDVNAIVWLLERCDIDYDSEQVDEIIEKLSEQTEFSNGKTGFRESEGIAAFKTTTQYPSMRSEYLSVLIKKIRSMIASLVQKAIDEKRDELKVTHIPTGNEFDAIVSQDMKKKTIDDYEDILDNFDFDKSLAEQGFDEFEDMVFGILEETADDSQIKIVKETLADIGLKINDDESYFTELEKRSTSDNPTLFPEKLSYLGTSIAQDTKGITYALATQTMALLAGTCGYVKIKNKEHSPRKKSINPDALETYNTKFIPFSTIVGHSGTGKSKIRYQIHDFAINLLDTFAKITDEDQAYFGHEFGDPKNTNKFRNVTFLEGSKVPNEPVLHAVKSIVSYGAKMELNEFADQPNDNVVSDSTDAGLRNAYNNQKYQYKVKRATKGMHFPEAYEHPVTLLSDELNGFFKRMYDSSITFGGSTEFWLERKAAVGMKVLRGTSTYAFDKAGLAISGNMVTNKAKYYLEKELNEGTDGVIPRFNFAHVMTKSDDELGDIIHWNANKQKQAQTDIAGLMMCARFASAYAEELENCPLDCEDKKSLQFNDAAQEEYGLFIDRMKERQNNLISKYPQHEIFIDSLFGKQSSELSIYAGGWNLIDQLSDLWFECKKLMGTEEEIYDVLSSGKEEKLRDFGNQINSNVAILLPKFKWSTEITANQIKRAADVVEHSYDFIEYLLYKIDGEKTGNVKQIVNDIKNDKIIEAAHPVQFQLDKTVKNILKVIQKLKKNDTFVLSTLTSRNAHLKQLKNNQLITDVLQTLVDANMIAIEGKTRKDSYEYRLLMTPSDIAKKSLRISKSIAESIS